MDSECISIEKQSFNLYYSSEDITDKCPENEVCVEGGCDILKTELDVNKMCATCNKVFLFADLNAKCEPSMDPGKLV